MSFYKLDNILIEDIELFYCVKFVQPDFCC